MPDFKLTVSQLNNYIKSIFDNEELLYNVSVFGEVTNYKISGNNAYFDIKDEDATLSCLEFGAKSNIKNGDSVLIMGRPNYHVKLGRFSFIVNKLEPYGQGDLYIKFLELKAKLEKQGVFSEEHKKPLPRFAHNIGVVASPTGAVIHDIINVTKSKNPFTNIILYPAKVQGEGAKQDICAGVEYFNTQENIDVVIVARGGGSMEDLAPFNTEEVAIAVFKSEKPIISAVGHETDFSLCDFAADMRAPTPSVAADMAVFDYYLQLNNLGGINEEIAYKIDNIAMAKKNNLSGLVQTITYCADKKIAGQLMAIKTVSSNIYNLVLNKQKEEDKKLMVLSSVIEKTNPLSILKAGYSKTYVNGKVLSNISAVKIGDELETQVINGKIKSKITKIGD